MIQDKSYEEENMHINSWHSKYLHVKHRDYLSGPIMQHVYDNINIEKATNSSIDLKMIKI